MKFGRRSFQQQIISSRRLDSQYVEAGPRNYILDQCLGQGYIIYQSTAWY
jgi:hypothetical protein